MTITDVLTPELVASVTTTVIGLVVTAAVAAARNFIKSKTSAEQFQLLQDIAYEAVHAAEQGKIGGLITDKKATAMEVATDALHQAGIEVSPTVLEATIEAAVLKAFNTNYSATVTKTASTDGDTVTVQAEAGVEAAS